LNFFFEVFHFLDRTKKLQNRTFDSGVLATDISKFVSSAHTDTASRIRILSNFDDKSNTKTYSSFADFAKYFRKLNKKTKKSNFICNL
jgi:hypothetical protein